MNSCVWSRRSLLLFNLLVPLDKILESNLLKQKEAIVTIEVIDKNLIFSYAKGEE